MNPKHGTKYGSEEFWNRFLGWQKKQRIALIGGIPFMTSALFLGGLFGVPGYFFAVSVVVWFFTYGLTQYKLSGTLCPRCGEKMIFSKKGPYIYFLTNHCERCGLPVGG
jgi:hypothetical protein